MNVFILTLSIIGSVAMTTGLALVIVLLAKKKLGISLIAMLILFMLGIGVFTSLFTVFQEIENARGSTTYEDVEGMEVDGEE